MTTQTPEYEILDHEGPLELRRYGAYLTASVRVSAGGYGGAANAGFNQLADYIFGNNHASDRISMTAPVTAGRICCERIAMTAPVTSARSEDDYVVSFTMPAHYTLDTLPRPNNPDVIIDEVPAREVATARFSGYFTEKNAEKAQATLEAWIAEKGLTATAAAVSAQYDSPWKPGFARHNEIMIPVAHE